jgi:hypothetical protein
MCIRRETREKARRSLAFSRVSKPHTHITHMLRQCTSIVYIFNIPIQVFIDSGLTRRPLISLYMIITLNLLAVSVMGFSTRVIKT